MRTPRPPRHPRSLAGQLFTMQVVLVAVVVAGCAVFAYATDRVQARESALDRAEAVATAVARSPSVREAIRTPHPSRRLQNHAEDVRRGTNVTFITIMDRDGVRWTHPDPERIGGRFVGHVGHALTGRTFRETYPGTLGPSVRVVTPVRDGGRTVGLVSAGITVDTITEQLRQQVLLLLAVACAALTLGGIGTYVVNLRLRRHTHGMNSAELSRMHDYHQATLHAVREGLLMLDSGHRVALINDGARELLGLDPGQGESAVGRHVAELGLHTSLTDALLAPEPRVDEAHLTDERLLIVNTSPVTGGEQRGTVVTLRDHTELQALSGELDSQRGFTEALRSQAHEAANRLHTVVSLIELGRTDDAVDFATEELELAQALTDQVVAAVGEPALAALLLGKAAQAHERGVELQLTPDSHIDDGLLPPGLPARDLVTVLGNLIDNALDAVTEPGPDGAPVPDSPRVTVTVRTQLSDGIGGPAEPAAGAARQLPHGQAQPDGQILSPGKTPPQAVPDELFLRVSDTGPGISPDAAEAVFRRGWSTKVPVQGGRGIGLALVRQTAHRHGGTASSAQAPDGGAEFTVRLPLHTGAAV